MLFSALSTSRDKIYVDRKPDIGFLPFNIPILCLQSVQSLEYSLPGYQSIVLSGLCDIYMYFPQAIEAQLPHLSVKSVGILLYANTTTLLSQSNFLLLESLIKCDTLSLFKDLINRSIYLGILLSKHDTGLTQVLIFFSVNINYKNYMSAQCCNYNSVCVYWLPA